MSVSGQPSNMLTKFEELLHIGRCSSQFACDWFVIGVLSGDFVLGRWKRQWLPDGC